MKLIVNGDDFGITSACNQVILDCWKKGRLTSCSLMVNMPAAGQAARLWKENPELSVGIHLCVTIGSPLTNPRTLMKDDGLFDKSVWAEQRPVDLGELETELEAQIARFKALTGRMPDHLDSHHGIERIPGGADLMLKLARKYNLPMRQFMNGEPMDLLPYPVPKLILAGSADQNLLSPQEFVRRIQKGQFAELALHPGVADEELNKISGLTFGRKQDVTNLCSDEFGAWLNQEDVELISWNDVMQMQ